MSESTPAYLEGIQTDFKEIHEATEKALAYIEGGATYKNHLHPFHNSAVATYNRLVSILLEIEPLQLPEEV